MTRHRFDQGTHEASVEARIERRRAPRGSAHEARPDAPPGRGVDRGETRGNCARGRTRRRKATPAPVPARGAKVPVSWLFRANGQTVIRRHAFLPQSLCVWVCASVRHNNATRVINYRHPPLGETGTTNPRARCVSELGSRNPIRGAFHGERARRTSGRVAQGTPRDQDARSVSDG